MYTIYADDVLIYAPDVEELCLYNIILTMEDNSAGTLTFNMVSAHPAFDNLKKLATIIRVVDDNSIIWKGRIISDDETIDNIKTIQCEGKLAFLNDSIFPEFDFSGAPDLLFQKIIENHNMQVGERQRFLIGDVTVKDKNDYIVRSSESALKTWKAVKEKCFQSTLGGHLRIRYEADGDYLDWLEDYQEISEQPISFGKNIIDLLVNTSATETYTAIRPQGAAVDGKRITIADVNEGNDYIVDGERAAEYGIIYAAPEDSIWDDVTLPMNLLKKAKEKLKTGIVLRKTIEVRAIDLNLTDEQIEGLKVCSYVRVVSKLHGIEEWYLLSKAEIYIDAPENTKYTLGAVKLALTDTNKQTKSTLERVMNMSIPTGVSQLENDKNYTTLIEVEEIIKESGLAAPVISVYKESDDTYILGIQTANGSFETPNLMGKSGEQGLSAYDLAVQKGFEGTEEEWIATLKGKPGEQGMSAYDLAVRDGFEGTVEEWIESLKGKTGEYLPITGGTLETNMNPILKLKRIRGNFAGIDFENPSGHLFSIEGYSAEDGTGKQLNVFARDWNKSLLRINERSRVIYDYKTKKEKEIVVKGDSVGALELPRINIGDANYKPGKNIFEVKEFGQESENIPTSNWYHIITMQGQDVREEYVTQLAIGMTFDSLYYRRMNKDDWGEWKKILLNGDALSSSGGTVTNSDDISVIKLFSNFLVQGTRHIGGILLGANEEELVRIQAEKVDGQVDFWIQDRILNKDIFKFSSKEHWILDGGVKRDILLKGEALPSTGGTIASATQQMLNLRYTGEKGDAIIQLFPDNSTTKRIALQSAFSTIENNTIFKVFVIEDGSTKQLLGLSGKQKTVFDPKTNGMKDIMVKGDPIIPTVKETILKTSTKELTVYGVNGSTLTDITDIFNKANTQNEGMRFGISPANGMGYIQAQNFTLNCALLTEEERTLLQSFVNIRIFKENNSDDFPKLIPEIFNFCADMVVNGKNGKITYPAKVQIQSTDSYNYFQYELPMDFRNDDFSKNVLTLQTKEWLVATGIDIKNRG